MNKVRLALIGACVTFLVLAIASFVLWHNLTRHQDTVVQFETRFAASLVTDKIHEYVDTRISLMKSLSIEIAERVVNDENEFTESAATLRRLFRGIQEINVLDIKGDGLWSFPARTINLEPILDKEVLQQSLKLLDENKELGLIATPVKRLSQGGVGFSVIEPITSFERVQGFLQGTFSIEPLLNAIFAHDLNQNFIFTLKDEDRLVYSHGLYVDSIPDDAIVRSIRVGNRYWSFAIALSPKHNLPVLSYVKEITLAVLLLLSALLSVLVYYFIINRQTIKQHQARYQVMADILPEMVFELDPQFKVRYANQQASTVFGFKPKTFEHGVDVVTLFTTNERFSVRKMLAELFSTLETQRDIFEMISEDGTTFPCEVTITPNRDVKGQVAGFVGVIKDVSAWRQSENKIEQLTHFDELTGLPNKSLLHDRLEQVMHRAQRLNTHSALLMIDIDRFKLVNDSVGHAGGDIVLRAIAERLSTVLRQGDTLARTESDEFAILLIDKADKKDISHGAVVVARKIINHLMRPFMADGREVFISGNIGIALYPQDASTVHELVAAAESAMYHAKSEGKNHYDFYHKEYTEVASERLDIERRLRYALKKDEFQLYYQPIVDVNTKALTGVEALLSWKDPKRGQLLPEKFLHFAEENGMIVPIGKWVFHQASDHYLQWKAAGVDPLTIAINVSSRQLHEEAFFDDLKKTLHEKSLPGSILELEIKEDALFDDKIDFPKVLAAIKGLGVKVALDDFGTHFSSISQLRGLPIDMIKIDHSFIDILLTDPNDARLVASMISFAQHMGMSVTAEGVEQAGQHQWLQQHGCNQMQGYYISKPLTPEELVDYLRGNSP